MVTPAPQSYTGYPSTTVEEVAAGPWQPVSTLGSVSRLCPRSRVSPKQQGKQPLLPDTAAPEHQHVCPAPYLSQAQEAQEAQPGAISSVAPQQRSRTVANFLLI